MPVTIRLPNGVTVTAPDDATPEELDQIANEAMGPPQSGVERAVRGFGRELLTTINPLPAIRGLANAISASSDPRNFAELTAAQRAAGSEMQGRSMAEIGQSAGERFKQSDVPEVVGRITGQAAGLGLPWAIGKAAPPLLTPVGRVIESTSTPMLLSAMKPTISALRSQGGNLAVNARRMANLVKRTGVRTAEQAEEGIQNLEGRIQSGLESATGPTDAPIRASRYLSQLERRAGRQVSPADDLATLAGERQRFTETSPLYRTETTEVANEVPSRILDESGRPMMTTEMTEVASRVPRTDVSAQEAMELARGTSRHATRKAWGEQKGMSVESQKAVERAARDAAKAASPPTVRADLQAQGNLLRLKPVLDRMAVREGNRDWLSLPGIVAAAPEIAQGRVPIFGMLAQYMRNNQMGVGLGAHRVGSALMGPQGGRSMEQMVRAAILANLAAEPEE